MTVVADTNVVVSAIFWPGDSRECLVLWARRRFHLATTVPIFEEYGEIARRVGRKLRQVNPGPWLRWIERTARIYEPAPLGKQRSRDPADDPFLACAMASGAETIISKDKDLLVLAKPFGVEIISPSEFLAQFSSGPTGPAR